MLLCVFWLECSLSCLVLELIFLCLLRLPSFRLPSFDYLLSITFFTSLFLSFSMAKKNSGTNPFTKHSRTSSQRQALRESIARTSSLLAGTPPAQCQTIIEDISLLFSRAFLQHECKKWSITPNLAKPDLIKCLLKDGWTLPQDSDIFQEGWMDPDPAGARVPTSPVGSSPATSSSTGPALTSTQAQQVQVQAQSSPAPSSSTSSQASHIGTLAQSVQPWDPMRVAGLSHPAPWDPRWYGMFDTWAELSSERMEEKVDEAKLAMVNRTRVMRAAQDGSYFPLLLVNDVDIGKVRCRSAPTQKEYRRPRDVEEMDFNDFLLAMCKAASVYYEAGQRGLAMQTVNLMQAALVESASKTRVSVMRACERVRMLTTTGTVKWDSDSLNRLEVRVLLDPLQQRRRTAGSVAATNYSTKRKRSPLPRPVVQERNSGVCIQWESGKVCKFDPYCKYKHVCVACGKVEFHDLGTCKLNRLINQRPRNRHT